MMQRMVMFVAATLLASPAICEQQPDPQGIWMRDDGNARVKISPCDDALCATNLWIGDTSKGEEVGDKLVMTLKPVSANKLSGNAYDPKRKRNYNITVTVGKAGLVTRGSFVGSFLCKDVYWTPAR